MEVKDTQIAVCGEELWQRCQFHYQQAVSARITRGFDRVFLPTF